MAKVTAPLFSFAASGKIANSLVFMKWKGLSTIRQWLVPANPKTAAQTAQRSKLTNAVAAWHDVLLTIADSTAWNALATLAAKPLSGFNQFVKEFIRIAAAGDTFEILTAGAAAAGSANELDVQIDSSDAVSVVTAHYGTKRTLLLSEQILTESGGTWSESITGLVTGQKYFVQFKQVASGVEGISGIYDGLGG